MNNLPVQSTNVDTSTTVGSPPGGQTSAPAQQVSVSSVHGKEREVGSGVSISSEVAHVADLGKDMELPKEVVQAGVTVQPSQVVIPPVAQQLGVQPAGVQSPLGSGSTVRLPLTDEQITEGLKKSVPNSGRWLAEWCIRKLKQLHIGLKRVHGTLMRVGA